MNDSNFKGIWIPKEILLDDSLTDKEKIVLSIVISFSEDNKTCYVGNRYLSKLLNVTQNRASKIVSSLQEKGYIEVQMDYYEDKNSIKSRIIILSDKVRGIVKKDNRYCYLEQEGIVPKGKYIINNNKKYYNKEYEFQKVNFDEEDLNSLYSN